MSATLVDRASDLTRIYIELKKELIEFLDKKGDVDELPIETKCIYEQILGKTEDKVESDKPKVDRSAQAKELRQQYPKVHDAWEEADIQCLKEAIAAADENDEELDMVELSECLKRTPKSIEKKIKQLRSPIPGPTNIVPHDDSD